MKIETKFDIGQKVFYINNVGKILSGIVYNIRWDSVKGFVYFIPLDWRFAEDELFATREEAEAKLKKWSSLWKRKKLT